MEEEEIIQIQKRLIEYEGDDRVVPAKELKEELDEQPAASWRIQTGFPSMKFLTKGFKPGDLIIVSARTGEGKTLFSQTMTKHFSKKNIPACWFTYEVIPKQFLAHFGKNMPKFYLPRKHEDSTLKWIKNRIWEAKLKYETKVVFIDHLHYLVDLKNINNTSLQIGGIVRELKKTALFLNIAIVLIAHTKKIPLDKIPTMNDIRDSSLICQEADYVIMLARMQKNKKSEENEFLDKAEVYLRKNRETGKLGKFVVVYKNGFFKELKKE